MPIDFTKLAQANAEVSYALAINVERDAIIAAGSKFFLDGHRGDPDYQFTAPQALLDSLASRRDTHIANAKAILNA